MRMKIFITIELVAIISLIISYMFDLSHQETTRFSDDGWTRHYTISRRVRFWTSNIAWASVIVMLIGVLFLIWSS